MKDKISKTPRTTSGNYAAFSLACRFIEATDTGKHFMVNKNACFSRARKIAEKNGVLIKYDSKTADYFAEKIIDKQAASVTIR